MIRQFFPIFLRTLDKTHLILRRDAMAEVLSDAIDLSMDAVIDTFRDMLDEVTKNTSLGIDLDAQTLATITSLVDVVESSAIPVLRERIRAQIHDGISRI